MKFRFAELGRYVEKPRDSPPSLAIGMEILLLLLYFELLAPIIQPIVRIYASDNNNNSMLIIKTLIYCIFISLFLKIKSVNNPVVLLTIA